MRYAQRMNETRKQSQAPADRATQLGPQIDRFAGELESTRRIPAPLWQALVETGLLHLFLPRVLGGEESHPAHYRAAVTALARHDASVAWNVFVANSAAIIGAFLEPSSAQQIFGNPAALVAWGPPNDCRARAAPGGYRVSGEWAFASGCRQASWMGAHCQVEEADGTLRLNRFGRPTVRTLLFPVEQVELVDNWHTIGLRGTASDGYRLDDLFVADAFSTTREDPWARTVQRPLYAIPMQGLYAVGVAGVAIGTARAMLDEVMQLAMRKTPRGLVRMADDPAVQGDVAQADAALSAATAWIDDVCSTTYDLAEAAADDVIDVRARARLRLATSHAIKTSLEVAQTCYRLAGVSAIFTGSSLERRYRDIHTVSQQIQSRRSHFSAVGSVMLDVPPEVFF